MAASATKARWSIFDSRSPDMRLTGLLMGHRVQIGSACVWLCHRGRKCFGAEFWPRKYYVHAQTPFFALPLLGRESGPREYFG